MCDEADEIVCCTCGGAGYGGVGNVGSSGYYWSSSLNADYGDSGAYFLSFDSRSVYWDDSNDRCYGYSVRGVLAEN